MTRRKFIRLFGSTAALTALAPVSGAFAEKPPSSYGGITPNDRFYLTTYGSTPNVNKNVWRLNIRGLVKHPLTLSYEDVRALPAIKEELTLECIGNPPNGHSIGDAIWVGPKLVPLLERAGVQGKAVYAALRAADGYSTGIPVDEMMRKDNFLPYLMNGVPLPREHGFPLRIFIPGKYGMKQPKWITDIEFVDHKYIGYWEADGWSNSAWRKVNSGFFYPSSGTTGSFIQIFTRAYRLKPPVELVGWAIAGPSGVRRVEVSTDGGKSWHEAQIVKNSSRYVWTVWKYHFAPPRKGEYEVRARATSGEGVTQPPVDYQRGAGTSAQPRITIDIL